MGLLICIPTILGMYASYHEYFDTTGGMQERFHSLSKTATDKVAIIEIEGVIMDPEGFVKRQIDRVREDQNVKAIVARINSPGGTVTASDYLYHHLRRLKNERNIPLVVSMGGMAASGGYYIAMAVEGQERSIYGEPTTTTGSIGVIIPHYDISGLLKRYDIKDDSIASHPRKQLLAMTKETSPEDREILQRYVNISFERFKDIVRGGRPRFVDDEASLDDVATGEIFTAKQAKERGLIDEIGFIEAAIDRAVELAGLDRDNVRVVSYRKNPTVWDALGVARSTDDAWQEMLLELSVPRAYYLCTQLGAAVRSN
jgi:protease-4